MRRMRVFAGPNGAGKSTLLNQVNKAVLIEHGFEIINSNRHINPDDLNAIDIIDFSKFGVMVEEIDFKEHVRQSPHYERSNINIENIVIKNNSFEIPNKNSYIGSILADYLRVCYIKLNEDNFSFETVLSHPSKVDFLKSTKECGWLVYLYYVCTEDPIINVARVEDRVLKGGHYVPPEKVIDRYWRSLANLFPALQCCHRAYIFDNSTKDMPLIAEKNPDDTLKLCTDYTPAWVDEYVLSKCRLESKFKIIL
ncbi:hypothetical protein [Methanosarcina siciliae]|nr:hypothetical protein [Methanosarcina siciliae]